MAQIRISTNEKIAFIANLSTMLRAGIPIAGAVDSLLEDAKGGIKKILLAMQDDLSAGKQVAESFAQFPLVFNEVTLNLIRAAEEAGTLETTLEDMRKSMQQEVEFVDKIKAALFYPMMIGVVLLGVIMLMLLVVVPKISKVFLRMKVDLPLPTRVMMASSDLILNHTVIVIGVLILSIAGLILLVKYKRQWVTRVLFAFPGVSQLILEIDVTRFTRSMHLLLNSGIPISEALLLSADVIQRQDLKKVILAARESAVAGHPFSEGLRTKQKLMPGTIIKLIEVGEKTGTLDKSMQDVSEFMDYQVSKSLKKITSMMEPIMLIVAGVAVGGLMMAIIAPIYSLIGQFGNR